MVDQADTIRRNSWMPELETEEPERKVTGSDKVTAAEARSVEDGRRRGKSFAGNGSRRAG